VTQDKMAATLRMSAMPMPARTIGDHQAEYVTLLGMLAATGSKIGREIYTLMKQEFGELEEPVPPGTVGSSTMPQKRNPISCVYITAQSAVVRTQVAALLNAMEQDHERATGQWEIEWLVLPEIFVLTAGCLAQTKFLMSGLQVDEKRMRANLDITKGLIVSEAVMMGLGPHLGRQYAHDLVYDVCRQVVATGRPLAELLAENKEIAKHMSKAELQKLCDPANYLGQAGEMVDRVLALRGPA
jgi:3-carboxy-cis,cis-muconate cycloisomerase